MLWTELWMKRGESAKARREQQKRFLWIAIKNL
jgi:hypothetical protein